MTEQIKQDQDFHQEAEQRLLVDLDITKISKSTHHDFANKILLPYITGWCQVEIMMAKLVHMKEIIELAIEQIKDPLTIKLANNNNELSVKNVKFVYKKGSATANFDDIPLIIEAKDRLKKLQELSKIASKNGGVVIDDQTGEVVPPCKFIYNKDSFTTKIS